MAATVNSKPIDPRCHLRAKLAESDLLVSYYQGDLVELIGTADQLSGEGFDDVGERLPESKRSARWEDASFSYVVWRAREADLRRRFGAVPVEQFYMLRIFPKGRPSLLERQLLQKVQEMREIKWRASPEYREESMRALVAKSDPWFQEKLQLIIGPTKPRRRGGNKPLPAA